MPEKSTSRSPGSLLLEVLIVVLIVVLLASILYPGKIWRQQERSRDLCRTRMENLYYAARFHSRSTKSFTSDINTIIAFARAESITVNPPGFKMDRLTREDSGIDSFQVEYYDPYQLFNHYKPAPEFEYLSGGRDSVVLRIVPLPQFDFAPVTSYYFAADQPITVVTDDRGDQGIFTLVGSQGQIRGTQVLGEQIRVPAWKYIFNADSEQIDRCAATDTPYKLGINVKIAQMAEMTASLEKTVPESPLSESPLLSSMLIYRFIKESNAQAQRELVARKAFETVEDSLVNLRGNAWLDSAAQALTNQGLNELAAAVHDSALKPDAGLSDQQAQQWESFREGYYAASNAAREDSTLTTLRDRIVNERSSVLTAGQFRLRLESIRKDRSIHITETATVNTMADSISHYSDPELIKRRLFVEHSDSVTIRHLRMPEVVELLARFSYTESYRVSRVDSVGVKIACPIEGSWHNPNPGFLETLFSVEGEKNHGSIDNGDLSWSEKR